MIRRIERRDGAFLQHGSIPLELDPARLFAALDTSGRLSAERGGALLARSVGWLKRWAPQPLSIDAVEERLIDVFSRHLGAGFVAGGLSAAELERAADLASARYADPAWTLRGIARLPGDEAVLPVIFDGQQQDCQKEAQR